MTDGLVLANTLANSATALAPKFRAAWRYSVALNAHEGNFQRAMDAGQRLRSIEPDFSVDRLVNDVDYPVASIRKSNVRLASLREIVGN